MNIIKLIFLLNFIINKDKIFGDNQESGLIKIDEKNDDIFYWLFKSKSKPNEDPLLIWLQGGPGSSSIFGCLEEICPYLYKNNKLQNNIYSWNNFSNLLIIDQPIGTGFSKGEKENMPKLTEQAAKTFIIFLKNFYEKYPNFKNRELYISTESYGGHYGPIFSNEILNSGIKYINLKGLLIGNGLVDLNKQYQGYFDYAKKYNLMYPLQIYFMKLVVKIINFFNYISIYKISSYLLNKFIIFPTPYFKKKFNPYNIKNNNNTDNNLSEFINSKEVLKELGVEGRKWIGSNEYIFNNFSEDFFISTLPFIKNLLSNNIRTYIWNGKNDYVCNYLGTRNYVKDINEFIKSEKINENFFDYIEIEDAGHMIPSNKPQKALEVLKKFLKKTN